jgi:hypothetical protein
LDEDELRRKTEDEIGPWRMVSKKDSARRQILMASICVLDGDWECAITLAGAAEGQIENTEQPTLFSMMKGSKLRGRFKSEREYVTFANGVRDWLKHDSDQKDKLICEFEAVFMVGRALSKYYNAYRDNLEDLKVFNEWRTEKGYSFKSNLPKGALKQISKRDAPDST